MTPALLAAFGLVGGGQKGQWARVLQAMTDEAEKVSRDAGSLPADVRGGKPSGVSHEEQTAMRGRNPNTRSTPTNKADS